jgi:hypothetical protein
MLSRARRPTVSKTEGQFRTNVNLEKKNTFRHGAPSSLLEIYLAPCSNLKIEAVFFSKLQQTSA